MRVFFLTFPWIKKCNKTSDLECYTLARWYTIISNVQEVTNMLMDVHDDYDNKTKDKAWLKWRHLYNVNSNVWYENPESWQLN